MRLILLMLFLTGCSNFPVCKWEVYSQKSGVTETRTGVCVGEF